MIILSTLVVIMVIGLIIVGFSNGRDLLEFSGILFSIFGGILLLLSIALLNHMAVQSKIAELEEVRATAERMRERGDTWESAAFQTKVSDRNAWLASTKYYNDTVVGLWIPDSIEEIEPIE